MPVVPQITENVGHPSEQAEGWKEKEKEKKKHGANFFFCENNKPRK